VQPSPFAEIDDEVTRFFRSLGYWVTWDFSRESREKWYEIYDGDELVYQADVGVPLADLLEDLECFARGKEQGTSASNYTVSVSAENARAICKRVREAKR
jgi:hypothetical protein